MSVKTKIKATAAQLFAFSQVKALFLKHGMELIVRVDQWESFYMEYPDRGLSNLEAGTLFGAVQIMHERVSVYLPELMYRREAIPLEHHEKLSCHMNAKGVLDIYTIDHKFLMNLEVLIRHLSCPVFPDSCNPA